MFWRKRQIEGMVAGTPPLPTAPLPDQAAKLAERQRQALLEMGSKARCPAFPKLKSEWYPR